MMMTMMMMTTTMMMAMMIMMINYIVKILTSVFKRASQLEIPDKN